jgi:4-hydroxy-tetrahydrodipicolinate synthase
LKERICDGVVSGVSCVLPELVQRVFAMGMSAPDSLEFLNAISHLEQVIGAMNPLPVPWGLKVIAEELQLAPATFAIPVAPERQQQMDQLRTWYRQNNTMLRGGAFSAPLPPA